MGMLSAPILPTGRVGAKQFGVKADGSTDDRDALKKAIDDANALGADLFLPDGVIRLSKYVDIANKRNLRIYSSGKTVIRYPSADTGISADGTAVSDEQARSALLLRNCQNVTIAGIDFVGDDDHNITSDNIGCGIYATRCVGTVVRDCTFINGGPYVQDALAPSTGTGDSLSVEDGVVTLTDSAASFSAGHIYRRITIAGATNPANNGTFVIESVPGATSLTFANPGAVDETSSFAWTIDDSDRVTRLEDCKFFGCRRSLRVGHDAVISNCHFEHPMNADAAGRGSSFAIDGDTVSFFDASGPFKSSHLGKFITIANATTPGNNGTFQIASVVDEQTITYENASGVAELVAANTTWWIANGDKAGRGNGSGALAKSGNTITLTANDDAFDVSDIGKTIRIAGATTSGNNGAFVIESVPAANQVTFTNASGASESYSGVWTSDSFDNAKPSDTFGSTHMIYLFAGRSNIKIEGCTFKGARTTGVKVSGSTLPIHSIEIKGCTFIECGSAVIMGADDSQEHTGLHFEGNTLIDCGTGRPGWSQGLALQILGASNVTIKNNHFHYTRPAIAWVDGRASVNGIYGIAAARYLAGISQPLEDLTIESNHFTSDGNRVSAAWILSNPIVAERVGQRAYWRTGGTLTKDGNTMTLMDTDAAFSQALVGCSIRIVNAPDASNNGTFTIKTVEGSSKLLFDNASGVGGGASAGTYRITPKDNRKGGGLRIANNQIHHVGTGGIQTVQCVAPEIVGNIFSGGGQIECTGDVSPLIAHNREINATTSSARIRLNSGTSWPIVYDNLITNGNLNTNVAARDWGVGVDSGTPVDYPLLGKRGRCKPTQARQEIVIAYGAGLVDGDTIQISGTTYTYKATAPGAGQFNSFAGLVALIDAQSGHDCADYGAQFSPVVTTQHMRVRHTAQTTTEIGQIYAQVNTLNPTALVLLRNEVAGGEAWCYGRGAASSSTSSPDRSVIWSPQTTRAGAVTLIAENEAARALLGAGSPAVGTITCVAKADLGDGKTITIPDGVRPPVVYEFDTDGLGVTGGHVQVDVSSATTAADVAAVLAAAIAANQPLLDVTDNLDGTISLEHKLTGPAGNGTITETVEDDDFTVAGMAGGTLGGYRSVKNGTEDPGACEVIQHGRSTGNEEFRWVIH